MSLFLRRAGLGVGIVALQWLVLGRLQIWGAFPDAVLLYVVLIGLRHGRLEGSITGFALGVLMDALYGTWGMQMFVKTIIGFLIGLFPSKERLYFLFRPGFAFLGALITAFVHNGLLLILFAVQSGTRTITLVTVILLGSSIYTAFVGTLASLLTGRR